MKTPTNPDPNAEFRTMTYNEWAAEGERRFGPRRRNWRFVCPSCGHVATAADWQASGAPEGAIAFSCVGRWAGTDDSALERATFRRAGGPCDYAGGGLIGLNPIRIVNPAGELMSDRFAFAD